MKKFIAERKAFDAELWLFENSLKDPKKLQLLCL